MRTGEQSPTAEELEIDRLRAEVRSLTEKKLELKREVSDLIGRLAAVRLDVRHLREAMQSVLHHAGDKTGDKADRLIACVAIARDTLKRVAQ